jgi:hypothetical protein
MREGPQESWLWRAQDTAVGCRAQCQGCGEVKAAAELVALAGDATPCDVGLGKRWHCKG